MAIEWRAGRLSIFVWQATLYNRVVF